MEQCSGRQIQRVVWQRNHRKARFAAESGAKKVVPVHFGLFDSIHPENEFICENKIVPEIYREIPLSMDNE